MFSKGFPSSHGRRNGPSKANAAIAGAALAVLAALTAGTGAAHANLIPAFTTPPAGVQSGLTTTVQYYVPTFGSDTGSGGGYVGGGGYSSFQGGVAVGSPSLQTLANMESFMQNGTFTVPASDSNNGLATTFTTAGETHAVAAEGDVQQASNPYYPGYPLNTVSAGQPVTYNVDQQGYIDIGTAGTYTFSMPSADDAAEVYVGGNGTIGSGTALVADGYNNNSGDFTSTVTTKNATFSTPGLYNFELFYYQGWGGQGITFTVTPPTGVAAPTFYSAVPEPASLGLCGVGAMGLLLLQKRRRMA